MSGDNSNYEVSYASGRNVPWSEFYMYQSNAMYHTACGPSVAEWYIK